MQHSGFTLMEMVLVVALLVIAAGLSIPLVDSILHPNEVAAANDAVRGNLEQARNRAMEEGRPYRFSIQENAREFRIEPDDADTNGETGFVIDGELPENCMFVGEGTGIIDASSKPQSSGRWKLIVVFLPDGTARDDAKLAFGRPGLPRINLNIVGLTGQVSQVREKTP